MSTVIDTPDGIAFYRLAALKGALDLQTKGMKLSRGRSATSIGKAQYGLRRNTASGQYPIVAKQVEDIISLREVAPAMVSWLGYQFQLAYNAAFDDHNHEPTLGQVEAEVMKLTEPTPAEKTALLTLARVWDFESRCLPAVRIMFRDVKPA